MGLLLYNVGLLLALLLGAPVWGWRMLRDGRYREGLGQRLGAVPVALVEAVAGQRVVWLHAVSVGEVLAAERLVGELGAALGPAWCVVVSTTTATGQRLARERFGAERVFFWPLDLSPVVRRYLQRLQPELLVLVESELWPAMLRACRSRGTPVVVANARMSDRSFRRARRLPGLWRWLADGVSAFLSQGQESAARLRTLGAKEVLVMGNLKYDQPARPDSEVVARLRTMLAGRRVVVAGSTLAGEESVVLAAWSEVLRQRPDDVLILAPRHPERFDEAAAAIASERLRHVRASSCTALCLSDDIDVLLLDTLGDLAGAYQLASVAFVGGSLVEAGGHNPLEAARYGVPVLMGRSYENFREVVEGLREVGALSIVSGKTLAAALLLSPSPDGGEAGQRFFAAQAGATARTVLLLREMLGA